MRICNNLLTNRGWAALCVWLMYRDWNAQKCLSKSAARVALWPLWVLRLTLLSNLWHVGFREAVYCIFTALKTYILILVEMITLVLHTFGQVTFESNCCILFRVSKQGIINRFYILLTHISFWNFLWQSARCKSWNEPILIAGFDLSTHSHSSPHGAWAGLLLGELHDIIWSHYWSIWVWQTDLQRQDEQRYRHSKRRSYEIY